jgi:hypothetical protein
MGRDEAYGGRIERVENECERAQGGDPELKCSERPRINDRGKLPLMR